MEPEIRQICETDIDSFREAVDVVAGERLYLYLTEAPPIERVRAFVKANIDKGIPHLVMVSGDQIAGWCTILASDRPVQSHVGTVAMGLRPEWRDRGWGTKLMQAALDAGDSFGFTRVELTVYTTNPRAEALYRKLGFSREGVKLRSVRIGETYFDEIVMARLRV